MVEQSFTALPTMKNPLDYIRKYPQRTKRLLGIDYPQFLQLLEQAQLKQTEQQAEIKRQKIRVNAKSGGRKPLLSIEEEVCMCLAQNVQTPPKKPRSKDLTQQQKEENKEFSSTRRIFVEHVIRLLRIFRIARDRFRLHPDTYEQVILTVCGLFRLRLGMIVLPVLSKSGRGMML